MVRKVIVYGIGSILVLCGLWFVYFGFIHTEFSREKMFSAAGNSERSYSYLTNPNLFPQWIKGFERSRRVTSSNETVEMIHLLNIQDEGESFQVIFTSTATQKPRLLHQKVEHPFYIVESNIEFDEVGSDSTNVYLNLTIEGDGVMERVLSPFFAGHVLDEYENQYDRALQFVQ